MTHISIEARVQSVYGNLPAWKQRELVRNAHRHAETNRVGTAYVWKTNGHAPFADMTAEWVALGFATQAEADATETLRKEQTEKFLTEYIEARKNHIPSAEERYELLAAFGPCETVVDVITGQRYTT